MLDTPTAAAYYHGPQNSKGLFNSIPSIPSTLLNISVRNYFQQPSQQETINSSSIENTSTSPTSPTSSTFSTSNDIVTTVPTAPTAPQQPTNKRTQRRAAQKQSVSANIAATAPQRVVAV